MPAKTKVKGRQQAPAAKDSGKTARKTKAKKTSSSEEVEDWRCVSEADYAKYINSQGLEDIDDLHPEVTIKTGSGRACRDSELGGYHEQYDILPARQVKKIQTQLAKLKSKPARSRSGLGESEDEEEEREQTQGGSHADIRRMLSNGAVNIKRTDINCKKTMAADDEIITPTWVKLIWSTHYVGMNAKLPYFNTGDIPSQYALVPVEMRQQTPFSLVMSNYFSAFAEYYTKGRDSAVCLAAVEVVEASADFASLATLRAFAWFYMLAAYRHPGLGCIIGCACRCFACVPPCYA